MLIKYKLIDLILPIRNFSHKLSKIKLFVNPFDWICNKLDADYVWAKDIKNSKIFDSLDERYKEKVIRVLNHQGSWQDEP